MITAPSIEIYKAMLTEDSKSHTQTLYLLSYCGKYYYGIGKEVFAREVLEKILLMPQT